MIMFCKTGVSLLCMEYFTTEHFVTECFNFLLILATIVHCCNNFEDPDLKPVMDNLKQDSKDSTQNILKGSSLSHLKKTNELIQAHMFTHVHTSMHSQSAWPHQQSRCP